MARRHTMKHAVKIVYPKNAKVETVRLALREAMEEMGLQQKLNFLYQLAAYGLMEIKSEAEMQGVLFAIRADVMQGESEDRKPAQGVR